MDYYLYTHSNANGIFYVGKGCGNRKDEFYKNRSAEWHEVAKNGYLTKIEATGTEECIFSAEKMYIKLLIEQGVNLVNKIHNKHWRRSDETKQKMSDANLGKTLSDETKKKISDGVRGVVLSNEAKERMSWSGRKHSDETKQKMSYARAKRWQHIRLEKANNYGG